MSEWRVNAYYINSETITKSIGSKDKILLNNVLNNDCTSVISEFKENGFADADFESGLSLEEVIASLINGDIKSGFPTKYALSLWAVIAELSEEGPIEPLIDYPFFVLYDISEVLERHNMYPNLLVVFKSLEGLQLIYELPISMKGIGYMPRFTCIKKEQLNILNKECLQMKVDIENNKDWVSNLEETQDLIRICNWIIEAHKKQKSICLVLDGDI